MQLATATALTALVLLVVLAAGYAAADQTVESLPAAPASSTR